MITYDPIPVLVLDAIVAHRPHLALLVGNYRTALTSGRLLLACQIGTAIAQAYLLAETRLSGSETWRLSHHVLGSRTERPGYGT